MLPGIIDMRLPAFSHVKPVSLSFYLQCHTGFSSFLFAIDTDQFLPQQPSDPDMVPTEFCPMLFLLVPDLHEISFSYP
jgi:hypothetical protein